MQAVARCKKLVAQTTGCVNETLRMVNEQQVALDMVMDQSGILACSVLVRRQLVAAQTILDSLKPFLLQVSSSLRACLISALAAKAMYSGIAPPMKTGCACARPAPTVLGEIYANSNHCRIRTGRGKDTTTLCGKLSWKR